MIYKKLKEEGYDIKYISNTDTKYTGGICTIPCYLAKGLEFDEVIISNAKEGIYNSDNAIDMKLLYVAMTRALHELNVLYDSILTKALS